MAELILIRHTEAEEAKTTDRARNLTKKGKKHALYLANAFKKELVHTDLFVHSGMNRAEQTLNLILKSKENLNIMVTETLNHEIEAIEFAKWLKLHAEDLLKIVVVGHEPHLSRFVGWAVARSNQTHIQIKKGGVVRLQITEFSDILKKRMTLTELISIKQLKSAGH